MPKPIGAAIALLNVTLFNSLTDTQGKPVAYRWATLCDLLANPPEPWIKQKKVDLPLLKGGRFEGDNRRKGSLLTSISLIECDIDDTVMTPLQAAEALRRANVECLVVTTASHTPDKPRFRVLAPLSAMTAPTIRHQLVKRLNGVLGDTVAVESFKLNMVVFIGRLTLAPHYACYRVTGACIDTLNGLDDGACGPEQREPAVTTEPHDVTAFKRGAAASRWISDEHYRAEALAALHAIPASSKYDTWYQAGAALAALSGGEALPDFDAWSRLGENYGGTTVTEIKWDNFVAMTQVGPGKLFWLATYNHGWDRAEWRRDHYASVKAADTLVGKISGADVDGAAAAAKGTSTPLVTLTDALEHWVWLNDGARVVDLSNDRLALSWLEHLRTYSASIMYVDKGGKKGNRTMTPVAEVWQTHELRRTTNSTTYAPGAGLFCTDPNGVQCLNLWEPYVYREADITLAEPFVEHLRYLLPEPTEFKRFLQYLAHIAQRPGEEVQSAYVFRTPTEGIGRNWVSAVLDKVWPKSVALAVNFDTLVRQGYNGVLSRKLLAVVDEIEVSPAAADKAKIATAVREMVTASVRLVNPKYGRQSVEWSRLRWLFFTNAKMPLPLVEGDRRMWVVDNPTERRPDDYYRSLYKLVKDAKFIEAVAWYLNTLSLEGFDPGERAIMNAAKERVIEASLTDNERDTRQLVLDWHSDVVSSDRLRVSLSGSSFAANDLAAKRPLHLLLQGTSAVAGRKRIRLHDGGDNKAAYVILRNHAKWEHATPVDLADEIERGERLNKLSIEKENNKAVK